ncbi:MULTISPECIES: type I restriction-modification system subunit M [Clostridium]|uniref:type I restriction-modification system subunit M n=1 Tax=Clostridium TaxID=1485 RepID=UPI0024318DBD|nr:class I SAM-dependent DNA methyltransferase [Clostridium beijerinckii]MDG5854671.1 class I SAM-dependent DNA methyltransferase [Clostridium beijerinckii]
MTNEQLKDLKDKLWASADQLRANSGLKSTEYATPILGLIFLRFAESKYKQFEAEINAEYEKSKGSRIERDIHEIAIEKCGFYLPEEAKYEFLLKLPEDENLAQKVKEAMIAVEKYTTELADTLPKDEYYSINGSDDKTVLKKLLKAFKDIPDDISIDVFGEIYEYFLGNFALAEGQGGGEFFTPSTVVRYMVEVLAPTEGKILDPACGSGGMFVQTAHYIEKHKKNGNAINLRAYGVEKTGATVKLAKMNLALNNIRGTITEANSYYNDPYDCFGNFDYVMANPPFNVDGIELDSVKNQPRFNTYGVPQNKTKKAKGDASEIVPNGNYLWINMFATSLKENGRAALVMANSASDAGNSEKDIRIKLIESGIISQMVTLPSNMFSTVTLPATLWFFNNAKVKKDEILFIDARNIFTQIDRAHRKFSDEQIKNLSIISRLYEGKSDEFWKLIEEYKLAMEDAEDKSYWQENIDWLLDRFPDGKYQDIIGLCKAATIEGEDGIKEQDYSLNPGRYVGVVIEEDGLTEEEFKAEMVSLSKELTQLNIDAKELERKIAENLQLLVNGYE